MHRCAEGVIMFQAKPIEHCCKGLTNTLTFNEFSSYLIADLTLEPVSKVQKFFCLIFELESPETPLETNSRAISDVCFLSLEFNMSIGSHLRISCDL